MAGNVNKMTMKRDASLAQRGSRPNYGALGYASGVIIRTQHPTVSYSLPSRYVASIDRCPRLKTTTIDCQSTLRYH